MMTTTALPASPVETVTQLALGYLLSRSLHVATELRLADELDAGPRSPEELAARRGAHAPSLARLLRTLAAQGVFAEDEQGRFENTPASALLRDGVMRDGVLLCGEVAGDGAWWRAAGALRHSVLTGEPAFVHEHGVGFFEYLATRPERRAWFDRGMANFASAEDPAIAAACNFAADAHVIDVGGGQGGLLAQLLARHRGIRATLFDLADVVREPAALMAAGMRERWTSVAGDFFVAVPPDADAYVLKRILHDWSDEDCVRILRRCRAAMNERARLLVAEAVLPEGNAAHPAKVMDILMMIFATGRERTKREFTTLFEAARLQLVRITPTASALSVIEARSA